MVKTIDNLIGGQYVNLSKSYFPVQSQFYEDFKVSIADSGQFDVSLTLSKTKHSWEDCQKLTFIERANIVKKAADSLKFTDSEVDEIIKMMGTPRKYILEQLNQIPRLMATFPNLISKRYGLIDGRIGLDFMEDNASHKIEFRIPKKGFVYAITPGNDPRITSVISTILALLGIPTIIKPSKNDNIVPIKIVKALIDAGYPKNGLAVLFLNSENANTRNYNFKICDEADIIWPFGDENTVDNLLRLEKRTVFDVDKFLSDRKVNNVKKESKSFLAELQKTETSLDKYFLEQPVDHFASKLILRHASGRCTGILDDDFDLDLAVKLIMDSSMRYPINCNSMKSIFVVEPVFEKLTKILKEEFIKLDKHASDPLNSETEVGYIDPKTTAFLEKRVDELGRLQLISVLHGGKRINSTQITPLLVSTNDINSELLINEIPAYILCLMKVKSFEEAVLLINRISKNNPKLAVSYLTNKLEHMRLPINAHHLKINYLTTDIDGLVHEGNDYIMQLTKPHIVHMYKPHLKEHPYRKG